MYSQIFVKAVILTFWLKINKYQLICKYIDGFAGWFYG